MVRLIRDRYFAYDGVHGCDLSTGDPVRLDDLPDEESVPIEAALAPLVEVLDGGHDGEPRWIAAVATRATEADVARRAALHARRKGFVPILVDMYRRVAERLEEELRDRALLLIAPGTPDPSAARAALLHAAARSPRPHVLLTFRTAPEAHAGFTVREARSTYGAAPSRRGRSDVTSPDVAHHVERDSRAAAFQAAGRHAAAERLLRDAAAALARRDAVVPAARALTTLGRFLLERGRPADAEAACDEAARLAEAGHDERASVDARLWQVAARTDAARLPDAEALCRAVLLAGIPDAGQAAWAQALLARILRWLKRQDEMARVEIRGAADDGHALDDRTFAYAHAAAARISLDAGDVFAAGQRARTLLERFDGCGDPLPPLIAHVAHLRVVAAAGDLTLARHGLARVIELAGRARAPLRAARARLVWHDALRRAGHHEAAQRELRRLERLRRAMPPLLRRAVDERLAATARPALVAAPPRIASASTAVSLVRLIQDDPTDAGALRRLVEHLAGDLRASRVDLVSADAGPVSTLVTTGSGLATRLGSRVLDAAIALPVEVQHGGRETGVPVRFGGRLLAALVARWSMDRDPPSHAAEMLELAAAIAAPRVDLLLADARETARASVSVPELVGTSAAMADVRRAIARAASAPFAVVVEGESGAGKELVARAIHQLGPRRERRFCDINCAALPDDLLESELFGHARGAFTGAVAERAGLFEEADGGTLFLDELPDLSPRAQAKLLRVLQQQEVRRIGETFSRPIDVRLVTATNRDMQAEVAEGRFRRDLLYRLDVIRIRIPPLRERPEDVPVLAEHFWRSAASRVGSRATLTHGALSALARYHWPGNVRELQNVVAALAVAAPSRGAVRPSLLPAAIAGATSIATRRLADARAQFERRCVEVALARAGGNRTRAAAELGLSRQGLLKTMARLGITDSCNDAGEREQ